MKTEFNWDLDSPEYQTWCEFINKLQDVEDTELRDEIMFLVQDLGLILENKYENYVSQLKLEKE